MAFRIGPPEPPHPRFKKPPGNAPPPPKTLFEQLLPVEWRGIPFPISSMTLHVSQDLVQHKYWGVDSANVESTGRAPLEIEATIPFVNGIVPGKNEKWGVLYPTVFRQFLDAFKEDRSTGILVHPELGNIVCKPHTMSFAHSAMKRDGVEVTAKWIETVDPDVKGGKLESPVEVADLAALDLDASKADILGLVPDAEFKDFTFEDLVNGVTAVVDQVGITVTLLQSKPMQILYRAQQLQDSLARTRSAMTWQAVERCERLKTAAIDMAERQVDLATLGLLRRKISRYTTQTTMTVSGLQAMFPKNSVEDLTSLNPQLLSHPAIPPNTVIRHYD